jgi:RNA polymerase sigma factor (sigma-70 family)
MNSGQLVALLQRFRRLAGAGETDALSDQRLLERYVVVRDESAFAALLRRHGGMVWGVCRRVLSDCADADDAFQATFLVLIHKAATLSGRESLAGWLQGVAWRVARKVKAEAARRRIKESRAEREDKMDFMAEMERRDLRDLLDEELDRLPEKYRAPLVLCYLEGMSYTEAARQLGWRDGTVCGRLARARELLRQRLSRRGLALSGAALTEALTEPASAPATALTAVSKMAVLFALSHSIGSGAVSPSVAALARGALRTLTVAKVKTIAGLVVVCALVAGGGGLAVHRIWNAKQSSPPRAEMPPTATREEQPGKESPTRIDRYGDSLPPGAVARFGTLRFRHEQVLGSFAISPDGKTLAAVPQMFGKNVVLWELATGKITRRLTFDQEVHYLAFPPDGKSIAVGSVEGRGDVLRVFDLASGKELRRFVRHSDSTNLNLGRAGTWGAAFFTPDGRTLLISGSDVSVQVLDAHSGKKVGKLDNNNNQTIAWDLSPDGKVLAVREEGSMKILRLYDVRTGKEVRQFSHSADVCNAVFSADGKMLAVSASGTSPAKRNFAKLFFSPHPSSN